MNFIFITLFITNMDITNNKNLLYNEFDKIKFNKSYIDFIWENDSVIKSYIFLINNIKKNIKTKILLTENEWVFYRSKMIWLQNILYMSNINYEYKLILLDNMKENMKYLGIE